MNIIVATSYEKKYAEFYKVFKRNGIKAIHHMDSRDEYYDILHDEKYKGINIFAVIKEKTFLLRTVDKKLSNMHELELVTHRSILTGLVKKNDKYEVYHDDETTEGYITRCNEEQHKEEVFGWDDIFVPLRLNQTYHQLSKMGVKISARDKVMSNFIKKFIHYEKPIVLHHHNVNIMRPVSFDTHDVKHLMNNTLDKHFLLRQFKLDNMINQVFNNGVMFRAPHTKVTKLVWYVLLNAGIPYTPKLDDPIHELVYMIHDFGHFLIPDLLFDGTNSKIGKSVYVIYRMISEAITIVLSDMLFVHGIQMSGGNYKTVWDRHIYQLFLSFKIPLSGDVLWHNLEKILRANINFVIKGQVDGLKRLISNNDYTALDNYVNKYDKVFRADYRWTIHNYDNTIDDENNCLGEWYNKVKVINDKFNLGLNTVSQFVAKIGEGADLVTVITDIVLENYIKPVFVTKHIVPLKNQLTKAFARYMMGQSYIFFRYSYVPYAQFYFDRILDYMMTRHEFTNYDIKVVRSFYDKFIDLCVSDSIISEDNAVNYKEVFPIMEPFAVSYDISGDKTLNEIYNGLINDKSL